MAYLDVAPMMTALRRAPHEFELEHQVKPSGLSAPSFGDILLHRPSKHRFSLEPYPHLVQTDCDCSALRIESHQARDLSVAIGEWRTNYWVPQLEARASAFAKGHAEAAAAYERELRERAEFYAWLRGRPAALASWIVSWFRPAQPTCHGILLRTEAGDD